MCILGVQAPCLLEIAKSLSYTTGSLSHTTNTATLTSDHFWNFARSDEPTCALLLKLLAHLVFLLLSFLHLLLAVRFLHCDVSSKEVVVKKGDIKEC